LSDDADATWRAFLDVLVDMALDAIHPVDPLLPGRIA